VGLDGVNTDGVGTEGADIDCMVSIGGESLRKLLPCTMTSQ